MGYNLVYLVMVTANNNNKYYKMIPCTNHWVAEYGRIGAKPQTQSYDYKQWDKKYREKIAKGYVDQTDLMKDLITAESVNHYKEISNRAIADIVERLRFMANTVVNDNYTIASDKVTKAMVDEAQSILNRLLNTTEKSVFNRLLLELFQTIPRKMSDVKEYLAENTTYFPTIIHREQSLLDVMAGQVITQSTLDNKPKDVQKDRTILEEMGLQFAECTADDVQLIKKLLGGSANKFKQAWVVINNKTQAAFDKYVDTHNIRNTRLLFHGSRNENWWSIINTGLVLRPTNAVITGKMFGYGLYFAPLAKKSLGYTSLQGSYWANGRSKSGFMALMDVAVGKSYDVYSFESRLSSFNYEKLRKACPDADSLFAHAGSMLYNDEIVVYNQPQCTIKYLIELQN